jgi:hypothetical protein
MPCHVIQKHKGASAMTTIVCIGLHLMLGSARPYPVCCVGAPPTWWSWPSLTQLIQVVLGHQLVRSLLLLLLVRVAT